MHGMGLDRGPRLACRRIGVGGGFDHLTVCVFSSTPADSASVDDCSSAARVYGVGTPLSQIR